MGLKGKQPNPTVVSIIQGQIRRVRHGEWTEQTNNWSEQQEQEQLKHVPALVNLTLEENYRLHLRYAKV